MSCTDCDLTCSSVCVDACYVVCGSVCNNGCTGGCSSCTGGCNGGCNSCSGTCTGDCNNACTSASASATIASMGNNIVLGNTVKVNDFINLRNAIHNELARRGKTIPNDTYTENPALNVKISIEHQQKIFDDIKVMDATKFKTIGTEATKVSTLSDAITYIKTLMAQNIK